MKAATDLGGRGLRPVLAAIVLRGAALRFFPIGFGLPHIQAQTVFVRYVMPLVPIACLTEAVAMTHAGR